MPGQAWLRIALPVKLAMPLAAGGIAPHDQTAHEQPTGLGFPQFTRFAVEGYPPLPPFLMSPLLCR